ncbi:hypothetical protein LYNGBM3L_66710 [Moorena producens 3L]|uniref:Uncharacterized protein n=1 Tax=Moorena producens 3L TaxID=489825 RepID=F4Y1N6_9CYAN|nr:hypothetical protein LYNGBM3L_66710 [Moorena producens 3L]
MPPLKLVENYGKTVEKLEALCGNSGESVGESWDKR